MSRSYNPLPQKMRRRKLSSSDKERVRTVKLLIAIIKREFEDAYIEFFQKNDMHFLFGSLCSGTAQQKVLDYLGIEKSEKAIVQTVVPGALAKRLIQKMVSEMGIDMPGNGIALTIPLESVGGSSGMKYLLEGKMMQEEQTMNKNELPYSLVVAITEQGNADVVMDAARSVGAGGGTVIHAKGTGSDYVTKFFGISIADEKDIVYIVTKKRDKDAIMKAIMQRTGVETKYRTAVFSLPVESVAGLHSVIED